MKNRKTSIMSYNQGVEDVKAGKKSQSYLEELNLGLFALKDVRFRESTLLKTFKKITGKTKTDFYQTTQGIEIRKEADIIWKQWGKLINY